MGLAHPFMPFITEEIWQDIRERSEGESLCTAPFPKAGPIDANVLADFDTLFEIITNIRNIRNAKQIAPKVELPLSIRSDPSDRDNKQRFKPLEGLIQKMANVPAIGYVSEKPENSTSFLIKGDEFYIDLADQLDEEQEKEKAQQELTYLIGFRDSVMKKLSNERFVANAKADVVERERQKAADAESKIASLEAFLTK
jgi:valyl-tRNA synthetase